MIDLVGAIAGTATYATIVGVLVGYSSVGRAAKLRACAAAAAWGALVVALAALGAFAPGIAGPVPTPVLAFVASTPDLVYVSPGVYVIADYAEPVFYASNYYWRYDGGVWYRSRSYTGGWMLSYDVPIAVRVAADTMI